MRTGEKKTMQSETTYSGILGKLQRFQMALQAMIGEVPHLEPSRGRIGPGHRRPGSLAARAGVPTGRRPQERDRFLRRGDAPTWQPFETSS